MNDRTDMTSHETTQPQEKRDSGQALRPRRIEVQVG